MTTRTNRILNPSFEVDGNNWTGSAMVRTRDTSLAWSGVASLKCVVNATGTSTYIRSFGAIPASPNTTYTYSYYVNVTVAMNQDHIASVNFYSDAGGTTYISDANATTGFKAVTGGWVRQSLTFTTPATCNSMAVYVYGNASAVTGGTFYVDGFLLEQASTAGTYFDGSLTDTSTIDYAWTGTAHASTSTATGIPPVANFTSVASYLSVAFTDTSTPTGTFTSWAWNFGDGTTSTSQSPTHLYAAAGTYSVSLTVTNAGGTTTVTKSLTVSAPPSQLLIPGNHSRLEVETVPGTWTDITGPTANISVTFDDSNAGSLGAEVLDATLNPLIDTKLRKGRPVRLRAYNYTADTYNAIFTGTIDAVSVTRNPREKHKVSITLSATNNVAYLAGQTEARGVATVDELRWLVTGVPFNINGATTPLGSGTVVSKNDNASIWDEVLLTRDTALGYAWVDKNNVLQVWDADTIDTSIKATVGPNVYTDLNADWDATQLINSVTVNFRRYNIGTETASDVPYGPYVDGDSLAEWGAYAQTFTLQGNPADEDAAYIEAYAQTILDRNSVAEFRPQSVGINFHTTADLTLAHKLDLNSRVSVVFEDNSASMVMRVIGIKHNITPDAWSVEYDFAKVDGVSSASVPPSSSTSVVPDGSISGDQLSTSVADALQQGSDAFDTATATALKVTGWTYSGTTKIDGGDIQTDTIGAVQIGANAITAKHTLTGPIIQTTATANRGIKINSAGLIGYDSLGGTSLFVDASTGAATFKGAIQSGSTITGTTILGSDFQTVNNVNNRGFKLSQYTQTAYDSIGNQTISLAAQSGTMSTTGSFSANYIFSSTSVEATTQVKAGTNFISSSSGLFIATGGGIIAGGLSITSGSLTMNGGSITNIGGLGTSGGTVSMPATLSMSANINLNSNALNNVSIITGGPTINGNPTWTAASTGATANVNWNAGKMQPITSSRRYKTGIEDLIVDLDSVYALVPRKYTRISDSTTEVGFIAEEALDAGLNDWVMFNEEGQVESFDYYKYVVALQAAVVDLHSRVSELEAA